MPYTPVSQVYFEPVGNEVEKLEYRSRIIQAENIYRFTESISEWQSQLVFENQPDDSERRSAQSERIARAGWPFIDREERCEGINFVRERDGNAVNRGRAGVVRAERLVVVSNRVSNARVFADVKRIVATHDALQFGEFTDH